MPAIQEASRTIGLPSPEELNPAERDIRTDDAFDDGVIAACSLVQRSVFRPDQLPGRRSRCCARLIVGTHAMTFE